jgi:hypothetical protein
MAEVGAARVHASASARSVRVVAPPPIPPEHKLELNHNGASTSTIASHSNVFGGTGSWGRSTGKRLGAGLTKLMNGLKLGKSTKSTVSVGKELQHVKFPFESPMPPPPIDIPHEHPGGSERSLEKKRPQLEWEKRERRPEPPLSPKGHSASLSTSNSTTLADTGVSVGYRSGAKGRSLDLGLGLAWAPVKVREAAVMPGSSFGRLLSGSWREQHGKEVAEVFRNALDEDGYLSFKKCESTLPTVGVVREG